MTKSGKRKIVFNPKQGFVDLKLKVPCGQCIGCRLEKSRQWALRCHHESLLHADNCFITLTYNDDFLPDDLSLHKKHFQDFLKRMRRSFGPMRYLHCGEYGVATEKNNFIARPHYHAVIFGFDFSDKIFWKKVNGQSLYLSADLEERWEKGYCTVGTLTFDSAAYVARYILKKVNGDQAQSHYERINFETGEVCQVLPEYITMSRRPGIATDWFDQFKSDCYPSDFITINGKKMRPPKFYDNMYEILEPVEFANVKKARKSAMLKHADNLTPERLAVREKCQLSALDNLPRHEDV